MSRCVSVAFGAGHCRRLDARGGGVVASSARALARASRPVLLGACARSGNQDSRRVSLVRRNRRGATACRDAARRSSRLRKYSRGSFGWQSCEAREKDIRVELIRLSVWAKVTPHVHAVDVRHGLQDARKVDQRLP